MTAGPAGRAAGGVCGDTRHPPEPPECGLHSNPGLLKRSQSAAGGRGGDLGCPHPTLVGYTHQSESPTADPQPLLWGPALQTRRAGRLGAGPRTPAASSRCPLGGSLLRCFPGSLPALASCPFPTMCLWLVIPYFILMLSNRGEITINIKRTVLACTVHE